MGKLKYVMTLALVLVLGVLIYYHFTNKDAGKTNVDGNTEVGAIEKVLSKDLDNNYPNTAREIVSYFLTIQQCYYNEDCTDNQLVDLAYKAMKLFDDELIEKNQFDEYYDNLTKEIDEYKSAGKTIQKTILDRAQDVIYSDVEGIKYASMNCIYYVKGPSDTQKVTETYILRCDSEGKWKILGWDLAQTEE